MIEKIIIVVHDEINVTIIKKYKDWTLETTQIEINKLSSIIRFIKIHKIPIFLFFINNNDQQQIYFTEDLPVISYLNLQMLLKKRVEAKIGNYDLKEVIKVSNNKQTYLFIAANIDIFWKNFIKMTSHSFAGIGFLALEAQILIQYFANIIGEIPNNSEPKMQLLMFYGQKNQIRYLIFVDYVINQTGYVNIDGISDKIIEGYVVQTLKDIEDRFKEYKKDAYLIIPDKIKQSLINYHNKEYSTISIFTPYELAVITKTDKIVPKDSKMADLCFVGNLLKSKKDLIFKKDSLFKKDLIFNIEAQKIAITKKRQNFSLNVASYIVTVFICLSSTLLYFKIIESNKIYEKLLETQQILQTELKETKNIIVNQDSKNKEKILIYKFLNSNDTSPTEQMYNLRKSVAIRSLEWDSSDIHTNKSDMKISVKGSAMVDREIVEKEILEIFSDYDLTTIYNEENHEIEIILKHK